MTRRLRMLRCVPCFLLVACSGAEIDSPPLRFETEHFRYHARPGVSVCSGLGAWLEHHYRSVGGALGAELGAGQKFDIYVFSDLEDLRRNACPPDTFGCAQGTSLYQAVPFLPHELVHGYARLIANPPKLLDEALAFVFGCGPGVPGDEIERSPSAVSEALSTGAFDALPANDKARAQAAASGFLRFLVDEYGSRRVATFLGTLARNASAGAVEQAFALQFASSLEEALQSWAAGPAQTSAGICLYLAECSSEPLVTPGSEELQPECVYGISPEGFLPWSVTRRLAVSDRTGVVVRASSRVLAGVRGCDQPLAHAVGDWLSPDPGRTAELWTELGPGNYWLQVGVLAGGDFDFSVSVEVGSPLFGERCEDAPVRLLPAETSRVQVFGSTAGAADDDPSDGIADLGVRLETAEPRTARIFRFDGQAWLCPAACPGELSECSEGSVSEELVPGEPNGLVVQGAEDGFSVRLDLSP